MILRFFLLAVVGSASLLQAAPVSWKAGVARVKITPPTPMWMSGYGNRDKPAEGTLIELWAKALALEDPDGQRAVLITMDLVGIGRDVSSEVTAELTRRLKIPRERLLLSTSHTHTGPVVGANLRAMFFLDEKQEALVGQYAGTLKSNLITVAAAALQDLQPARLSWGQGRATFAVNRRNNREADIPQLRELGNLRGPSDHDVPVLLVRDAKEKLRIILCGYACHATVLSFFQWSGDWPGFAQLALEDRHPGVTAMFWAGCGADQNPLPRREVSLAREYGGKIADAIDNVLKGPMKTVEGSMTASYAELPLPFAAVPTRADLEKSSRATDRYETNRAGLLLAQLAQGKQLSALYPYPVQVWRFGPGPVLIALGGEVVVDYALRLKAELGREKTWVMGYANDVMAYIPSRRVLAEGGYEGGEAMVYYGQPSPWASQVEDLIVGEVHRQLGAAAGVRPSPAARLYPDHSDLTAYLDDSSRPQLVKTAGDWEHRRAQILQGMQEAMGRLPARTNLPPVDVKVIKRTTGDAYETWEISYLVEGDERVPAYLLIPRNLTARAPAMLCLHQTTKIGKGEPIGLGPKTNLHYARELAQRGYVCLAPDYPSFGDYTPYDFGAAGYPSGTMRGIANHMRAVDLLGQRPEVDAQRIGVIGHSLGGHNAMFVGVFDPRLKVIVTSCGWTPFHDYYGGKIAGWTSDRYMPLLRTKYGLDPDQVPFDFYEIVAALAPRAFFSNSPLHDENFSVAGVTKAAARARHIYELLGASGQLVIRYPDCGHDFPPEIREEAYQFIDQVFGRK